MDKWIPAYAFFSLIGCFVWNCLVYSITQHLGSNLYHYDFTTGFDRSVPFCPAWVSIYVLSFPFWVISYALTARENSKEFWYRFVFADMLARVVCGVFFLLIPTTNVRPEITGDGFWDNAMAFIYAMDMPVYQAALYRRCHRRHHRCSWLFYAEHALQCLQTARAALCKNTYESIWRLLQ